VSQRLTRCPQMCSIVIHLLTVKGGRVHWVHEGHHTPTWVRWTDTRSSHGHEGLPPCASVL